MTETPEPPLRERTGDDLALQLPGHSVLARIGALHAAAADVDGMPGVVDDEVTSWCVGYVGERIVGEVLAGLPTGWHVLHAVPVGLTADIDHVLVGPPGVVVVNTKHLQGAQLTVGTHAVFVSGQQQYYLQTIRRDAAYAGDALGPFDLPVHRVICVVGARRIGRSAPAPDVLVVDAHLLVPTLNALPARVPPAEVARAFDRLRRAGSWTTRPPVPAAPPWVAEYAVATATEERLVKDGRRRRAPVRATPRRRSAPARRRWYQWAAALLVLLAMLAALSALPALMRAVSQQLVPTRPAPATSAPATTPP